LNKQQHQLIDAEPQQGGKAGRHENVARGPVRPRHPPLQGDNENEDGDKDQVVDPAEDVETVAEGIEQVSDPADVADSGPLASCRHGHFPA
jgi:hypothetical protein